MPVIQIPAQISNYIPLYTTGNLLIVVAIVSPVRVHRIVNVIKVVLVAVAFAAVVIETVRLRASRLEILAILHGIPVFEIAHTAFSNLTDVGKICLPEMIPSRQAYIHTISAATEKNTENTQSPAPPLSTKDGTGGYPILPVSSDRSDLHEPHVLRDIRGLVAVHGRLVMDVAVGILSTEQIHRRGIEQTGLNRILLHAIRNDI